MTDGLEGIAKAGGCIVSVIGPDGAGKSTLIDALYRAAEDARLSPVRIHSYRWHRNVFVMPLRLIGLKHQGRFVLLDRCLFDNIVELGIRLNLPSPLRSVLTKLVSRFYAFLDVRILLLAPPDVIAARRPEESTQRTARQLALYAELSRDAAYHDLDSTRPTLQPAIREIRRRLASR